MPEPMIQADDHDLEPVDTLTLCTRAIATAEMLEKAVEFKQQIAAEIVPIEIIEPRRLDRWAALEAGAAKRIRELVAVIDRYRTEREGERQYAAAVERARDVWSDEAAKVLKQRNCLLAALQEELVTKGMDRGQAWHRAVMTMEGKVDG